MTDNHWAAELALALYGTDWVVDWAGVTESVPKCLANVHHRGTKASRRVDLLRDVFGTPAARKATKGGDAATAFFNLTCTEPSGLLMARMDRDRDSPPT